MNNVALITGVTGQDGHYLARHLIARGYRVVGTSRGASQSAVSHPLGEGNCEVVGWDLVDPSRFEALLRQFAPSSVFNLAAFTSGEFMNRAPEAIADINGVAVLRMLETIRAVDPSIRFCQASSSEVFAGSNISPQNEETPRAPRSIYGAAKIFADSAIAHYRQAHGMFGCSAFLFNHESPRRGGGFVTTKVVRAAVAISRGHQDKVSLGNLEAARDWGFAGDYMSAMTLMAEAEEPRDFVIGTGTAHTVADFCKHAFAAVGLDYRDHVEVDERYYRPVEPTINVADPRRAHRELGWRPEVSFEQLVAMMIDAELALDREEGTP